MSQLPPRPSAAGFAQRLWDNIYNPQSRQAREFGNSLKTDVHKQLKRGQSLRRLLKIVENVLEGTVEVTQLPSKPTVLPRISLPEVPHKRAGVRMPVTPKKARTTLVAPSIEPVLPKFKVAAVPAAVTTAGPEESEVVSLARETKASSRRSSAKENIVQYVRRIFGKQRDKSTVEVVKRRRQSPLVSTMASLLY